MNKLFSIHIFSTCRLIFAASAVAFITTSCYQTNTSAKSYSTSELSTDSYIEKEEKTNDFQIPEDWTNYSMANNAFSIGIPNTLELNDRTSPYAKRIENLGFEVSSDVIIFQQKGLNNSMHGSEDQHYCRLMMQYTKGNPGDFAKSNEMFTLSKSDMFDLKLLAMKQLGPGQTFIVEPQIKWVDFNGYKAIAVNYTRSGNDGNTTKATIYLFMNYNEVVQIIAAYRESESHLWAADLQNALSTFRWK